MTNIFETGSSTYKQVLGTSTGQPLESPNFLPITERIPQIVADDSLFPPRRVTYQFNDLCNLACGGCYVGDWLKKGGRIYGENKRKIVPPDQFEGHLDALGPDMESFYMLGTEATVTPDQSRNALQTASGRGLVISAVTNAATRPEIFDRTFGEFGPEGLSKLVISVDSIDPEVHDKMRGKKGALAATLENLDRYVLEGYPVKAQTTIFTRNYSTVLDTVEVLYQEHGVRRFGFHCASLEGVSDAKQKGIEHVDPLAWRALFDKLYRFRESHMNLADPSKNVIDFNLPYLYLTEQELREKYIGDPHLADEYLSHVADVENGVEKPMPFISCPKVATDDPYIYGNDGPDGVGRLVQCCILTGGHEDMHHAQYDPDKRQFVVNTDPGTSELHKMKTSPYLCPAMDTATGGQKSDRVRTDRGDLYHVCRFTSSSTLPYTPNSDIDYGVQYEKYRMLYSSTS